jgi:hypothetical protein
MADENQSRPGSFRDLRQRIEYRSDVAVLVCVDLPADVCDERVNHHEVEILIGDQLFESAGISTQV